MTKKTYPSKEIIRSQLVWHTYEIIPVIVTKEPIGDEDTKLDENISSPSVTISIKEQAA